MVYDEFGTPVADEPQHWLPEVALRVDFAILDSVYAMEEKITNASMQSKVSEGVMEGSPACLYKLVLTDNRTLK